MMKFASFETIVEMIYKQVIPTPKEQCSKNKQLGVSFAAGYIAGVLCAIVSHPADNLVSFLNNAKGATVGDVSEYISLYIHTMLQNKTLHNIACLFAFCAMLTQVLFTFGFAGCEEDWGGGSFHSRPSASYCYDWNTNWSSVGTI